MPAARLTPEELARKRAGFCVCGCGAQRMAPDPDEHSSAIHWDRLYASQACRQRAYSQRKADGRVLSAEDRRRIKAREMAKAERALAKQLDYRIEDLTRERDRHLRTAAKLEEDANGQTTLPGCVRDRGGVRVTG